MSYTSLQRDALQFYLLCDPVYLHFMQALDDILVLYTHDIHAAYFI